MDRIHIHHISPPPTPTFTPGHFFSKTKASIISSTQRVLHKRSSTTQLRYLKNHSEISVVLAGDLQPPEDPSGSRPNFYISRANSNSFPSLPLPEDKNGRPLRQVKQRPSVPTFRILHRSPRKPDSPRRPKSLERVFVPPSAEPLAIVTDFKVSPSNPVVTAAMEPASRTLDVSEAVVNYGPGYGVGAGIYRSNGNATASGGSMQNPAMVYQHIHELSSKRISTLDYLRKAHQGHVYWFNTLLFSRADLMRLPGFEARRLAKRATNYLLLGLSIPTILDLNASSPMDYLRALNALLAEFETYQQIHPSDGSASSSLSRAKIPQMFKRSTYSTGGKGRRSSAAADIGLPTSTSDPTDLRAMSGPQASAGSSTASFGVNEQELLPGEEYTHLLTPFLPFDPDFFETFATLCDVLIDCYVRITHIVSSPTTCGPGVGEMFAKADARLRKVIVAGIVKEFEDASRGGIKNEISGIGKVVLGGLI